MPQNLDYYVKLMIADLVIGQAQKLQQIDTLQEELAKHQPPPAPPEAPKTDG